MLQKSEETDLQAIDQVIELLDNQLNPEQKISLDEIRRQIMNENEGNQVVIKQEKQQLSN